VGVSGSGLDLKDALLNGQQRHIKGATTQVKDEHIALAHRGALLVQAVRNGCSRGLIDDAHHLQTGNHTCGN
jgi:hypothetical protein